MTGRSELEGVAEEVENDLSNPIRIRFYYLRRLGIVVAGDREILHFRLDRHERNAVMQEVMEVEVDVAEFKATVF